MLSLGIESTAHSFGIGIVNDKGKILANETDIYTTKTGGMIPNEVALHHQKAANKVLQSALKKASLTLNQIDVITFSQGPGLAPCLLVGLEFAKNLAQKHNKPLIGINHCVAHLTIGELVTHAQDPVYLYVSGVNTQVIAASGGYFRLFGETLDIALGNCLDKFGRAAGLGFPAGPEIEKLARQGKWIELPYLVKGMDVSFSGLLTNAINKLKTHRLEDLCFSLQEVCFAMLAEVSERAMAHTEKNELLLIGGVAANKRFCQMLQIMCQERQAKFFKVPLQYTGDQGAMIAWQGLLEKEKATTNLKKIDIKPYWRLEDVKITWK